MKEKVLAAPDTGGREELKPERPASEGGDKPSGHPFRCADRHGHGPFAWISVVEKTRQHCSAQQPGLMTAPMPDGEMLLHHSPSANGRVGAQNPVAVVTWLLLPLRCRRPLAATPDTFIPF